ncbi:MAG: isoaspartyl peptidase/L-asparaginase, partial [Candidatus Omnitrophica bacterium]|nr:isoaspartyl peptidase/L-asparaginase [Candidatus Omnitrophota bacterium]
NGHLAAATSTGGKGGERVGRVSDSALPAGNYANSYAACSATGFGEDIIDEALSNNLVLKAEEERNFAKSFKIIFRAARKRKRRVAAIGVGRNGIVAWSYTTEILYYAFHTSKHSGIFPLKKKS